MHRGLKWLGTLSVAALISVATAGPTLGGGDFRYGHHGGWQHERSKIVKHRYVRPYETHGLVHRHIVRPWYAPPRVYHRPPFAYHGPKVYRPYVAPRPPLRHWHRPPTSSWSFVLRLD